MGGSILRSVVRLDLDDPAGHETSLGITHEHGADELGRNSQRRPGVKGARQRGRDVELVGQAMG